MAAITRAQFRAALFDIMDGYRLVHPDELRKVHRYRPGGVAETPTAWVGTITQSMDYSAGLAQTVFTGEVVIVEPFPVEQVNADDQFDALEAGLKESFIDGVHEIPNTVLTLTQTSDGEETFGGPDRAIIYRSLSLQARLEVWEGRTLTS